MKFDGSTIIVKDRLRPLGGAKIPIDFVEKVEKEYVSKWTARAPYFFFAGIGTWIYALWMIISPEVYPPLLFLFMYFSAVALLTIGSHLMAHPRPGNDYCAVKVTINGIEQFIVPESVKECHELYNALRKIIEKRAQRKMAMMKYEIAQ